MTHFHNYKFLLHVIVALVLLTVLVDLLSFLGGPTVEATVSLSDVALPAVLAVVIGCGLLFWIGLPLPAGYARGKVKWVRWCATGMHFHTVFWNDGRFQTKHPGDSE